MSTVFSHRKTMHYTLFFFLNTSKIALVFVYCFFTLLALFSGKAYASQVMKINAGPYKIDVNISQVPPPTDQPFGITIISYSAKMQISGQIIEEPAIGTDAAKIYITLSPQSHSPGILEGTLRMPVRGAWNIVLELDGPLGHGTATIPLVVSAPGAMPIWLGWSIGSLPAWGLLWWVLRQRSYQRMLLLQRATCEYSNCH